MRIIAPLLRGLRGGGKKCDSAAKTIQKCHAREQEDHPRPPLGKHEKGGKDRQHSNCDDAIACEDGIKGNTRQIFNGVKRIPQIMLGSNIPEECANHHREQNGKEATDHGSEDFGSHCH